MNKIFKVLSFSCIVGLAGQSHASEVRVDSTGGLGLVLTDETTAITPYMLGNPAGLALLPRENRLDLNLPLYTATNGDNTASWGFFGISPGSNPPFPNLENSATGLVSNTAGSQYQGFQYFPKGQWAFQLSGGFYNADDNDPFYLSEKSNLQSFHGVVRAAGDFDVLSVGTELQFFEAGSSATDIFPYTYTYTTNQVAVNSNTGLLLNFKLGDGDHPAWLRLGGSALFNIVPSQETITDNFGPGFTPPVQSWTNKDTNYSGAPCLFLDIPGSFQAGFVANFNFDTMTANMNNGPFTKNNDNNSFNFAALYKWKIHLAAPGLTFNNGILLNQTYYSQTYYSSSGDPLPGFQDRGSQVQVGLGLEREKDFTLGLQVNGSAMVGNSQFLGYNWQYYDFTLSRISLGGEKWISPSWALRLGLNAENGINNGSEQAGEGFYFVYPGQEVTGVMATLGAGYQAKSFTFDGMVWFEQPQSLNLTGPTYSYTVFGLQVGASILFGS